MAYADGPEKSVKKRPVDLASLSGSSTSDESARRRKRWDKHRDSGASKKESGASNGTTAQAAEANVVPGPFASRRGSLGKAARDPRDEPHARRKALLAGRGARPRSPTPVIDFDGLSRPGKSDALLSALLPCVTRSRPCSLTQHRSRNPRASRRRRRRSPAAARKDARCCAHPPRVCRRGSRP